jgi:hypothetical protein
MYTDTPLPQEEPAGQNPPDGAIFNFYLKENAKSPVILEIFNKNNELIRRFTSEDKPYKIPADNTPPYWIRPQQILPATAGSHRFMWDLHYPPLDLTPSYPISAIYQQTVPDPTSPWVLPGEYVVKLTVNGKTYEQPLSVRLDPRVKMSDSDLKNQHDLALAAYKNRKQIPDILKEINALKTQLSSLVLPKKDNGVGAKVKELTTAITALENTGRLDGALSAVFGVLQDADMPPTTQALSAATETQKQYDDWVKKWQDFKNKEIPMLNESLKKLKVKGIF